MSQTRTPPKSGPRPQSLVTTLDSRRRRSRRSLRLVLALLVLAVLAAGGFWVLKHSATFAVNGVEVSGTSVLSQAEVTKAAQVPLGVPLVDVDLAAVGARVARLTPVAEVRVARSWPATVTVEVRERTPVYAMATDGGYVLVDAAGIMFAPQPSKPDLVIAKSASNDARQLGDLAAVVQSLSPELRERTQKISAQSVDDIELNLTKGDTLLWGSSARSEAKARVALALLKQKGTVYNVVVPAHPTIR